MTGLLAGRASVRTLHPFLASEFDRFDLAAGADLECAPLLEHIFGLQGQGFSATTFPSFQM